MNNKIITLIAACSAALLTAQESHAYKFSKKIDLPGNGKWDYMCVDDTRHRLYVSHEDRVHIIDLSTDQIVGEWTGLSNVHGITCDGADKVYIANTAANNVLVYNAGTLEKMETIELPGAKKPDCILYDAFTQKVFVFCGKSNNIFVIDATTNKIASSFETGGKPEFACTNGKGLIYNNLEDKNEVIVIDAQQNKIVNRFSLGDNKAPTGIAIDKQHERLMVTCEESEKLVVLSAGSGKIITTLPIGAKTDGVIYDSKLQSIVTSNGWGSATVISRENADKYAVMQTLKTQAGLKTIACDEKTQRIFMTGAGFGSDGKTIVPGTFAVFIYTSN